MELDSPNLDIFVPDNSPLQEALARTTQLGIGAHADDLEIMAYAGIAECHESEQQWFTGVTVCDGAGSPRSGPYADYSDEDMIVRRRQEQRDAANLGQYSLQLQLGYSSTAVKDIDSEGLVSDLVSILQQCRPKVVYLHNIADTHETHVRLAVHAIAALRQLDAASRPESVYGVEVWGSLDWLAESRRVALPVETESGLQERLLRCHDSQVGGGKAYDVAVIARQRANATFANSHQVDTCSACVLAMDLMPLLDPDGPSPGDYLRQCLEELSSRLPALGDPDSSPQA